MFNIVIFKCFGYVKLTKCDMIFMDFCILFQKTEKRFVIKMRGMKQNFGEVYIHILELAIYSLIVI